VAKTTAQLDREIASAMKSADVRKLYAWRPKLEETIVDVDEGRISRSPDQPVRVSRLDSPRGAYLILDGHHRTVEALRRGRRTIPIKIDHYVPRIERAGGAFQSYVDDKVNVYERVVREGHATKRGVGLRDLDLLAQAVSFGDVSVEDLVPSPRTIARLSPSNLKRSRAARRRLVALVERGLLEEAYGDRFVPTTAGKEALVAAGFAPNRAGSWLRPGARVPGWAA